jgi:heat shock protein HtpX
MTDMFKRIALFMAVNFLVVLTIGLVMNILGVRPYLNQYGIDYESLLIFCAIWGFGGALFSLATSKWMAKMMMGVRVIDPSNPGSAAEKDLVQMVYRLAQKGGITQMPEVGIYDSPEVNAFATGPSKNRSLVAVSAGLLNNMDTAAVEGVLGHEITHITNGDMVTMTLLQGVVNTFVMFFARVAAWVVSQAMRGDRDRDEGPSWIVYSITTFVFEILFSFLGMFVLAWFSRRREFRADAGGARLAGRERMVHALQSLKGTTELVDQGNQSIATLKINGRPTGLLALLQSHPNLDDRIKALQAA